MAVSRVRLIAAFAAILFAWLAASGQLERATKAQWRVAALAGVLLSREKT